MVILEIIIIILLLILLCKRSRKKTVQPSDQKKPNNNPVVKTVRPASPITPITPVTPITPIIPDIPVRKSIPVVKETGIEIDTKDIDDITLDIEQSAAYNIMESTTDNLFITGKAGTGKSVLLQYFIKHVHKQIAVVAPTGVAALNVGGQTIHSFFGLQALDLQDPRDDEEVKRISGKKKEVLEGIDVLVIDEISMVSSDIMDMIDAKLKFARHCRAPFGGCQVICFGDLYQLPPVVISGPVYSYLEDRYGTVFFFGADAVKNHPFRMIELQKNHRQNAKPEDVSNQRFIDILNRIRIGKIDSDMIRFLNQNCVVTPKDNNYVTLTGDNSTASEINRAKLRALPGQEYTFTGYVDGDIKQQNMPTDLHLRLKVGALVMMIRNDRTDNTSNKKDQKARWVNGTLGVISKLGENEIKVRIHGVDHWIERETWEKYQYVFNVETKKVTKEKVGSFTQYPIKLAYALTIHKSQGQTLDAVKIDLKKGAFADGQVYVALSRCRSIERLYFEVPITSKDIRVNPEVVHYMTSMEKERLLL